MPHYTDEHTRAVFDRDMDEVHDHYRRLAERHRPGVERAIANLTGHRAGQTTDKAESTEVEVDDSDLGPEEPLSEGDVEGSSDEVEGPDDLPEA